MHCDTLKQDNDSTVQGDGGSRVGEVRAGTTTPMPKHKGFMLQLLSEIHPITPAVYGLMHKVCYFVYMFLKFLLGCALESTELTLTVLNF